MHTFWAAAALMSLPAATKAAGLASNKSMGQNHASPSSANFTFSFSTVVVTTTTEELSTTITTTTAYCFEDATMWEPIDMFGQVATIQTDEWACQRRCLQVEGCAHFSFSQSTGACHLQDAFAIKREQRAGFLSGPFECWSSLTPGKFAKIDEDVFVPEKFRCMQVGVIWQPALETPVHIYGEREEVVRQCQARCKGTWGCGHFTALFPNLCQLAGGSARPLPAVVSTMSGPAVSRCQERGYIGHTFMKKAAVLPDGVREKSSIDNRTLCAIAMIACGVLLALARLPLAQRRTPGSSAQLLPQGSGFVSEDFPTGGGSGVDIENVE